MIQTLTIPVFVGRYPHVQRQPSIHQILHSFPISTYFPRSILPHRLSHHDRHCGHLLSLGHRQRLCQLRPRGQILEPRPTRNLSQLRSGLVFQRINEHCNRHHPSCPPHAPPLATTAPPHAKDCPNGRLRHRHPRRGNQHPAPLESPRSSQEP